MYVETGGFIDAGPLNGGGEGCSPSHPKVGGTHLRLKAVDETHNSSLEKQSKAEVKYYKYVSYIPLYDTSIVNLKMLAPKLTIGRS